MVAGSRGHGPGGRGAGRTGSHKGSPQPATDRPPSGISPGHDPAARRRLALAAGHRGDLAGALALLGDDDPAVRATALGAVVRAGGLVAVVVGVARTDTSPAVRRRACEELGRMLGVIGVVSEGESPDDVGDVLDVLRTALVDRDDAVVEAAAWAAGEAGSRASTVVDGLARVATEHRAALCREAAVAALGAIGAPAGIDAVLVALGDRPAIRRRAAVALAAFEDPRAEEGLRRCLGDRDWQVRQVAEELLND